MKRFFKKRGAKEGISLLNYSDKYTKQQLLSKGNKDEYFNADDKKFKPFQSVFRADEFERIVSIEFLENINNNSRYDKILC